MMTNSLPLRQTDVKWFQHVGDDHVGVLGVRPRLCRVDVQLEILHHHREEYKDAVLCQRLSQADPLADAERRELKNCAS